MPSPSISTMWYALPTFRWSAGGGVRRQMRQAITAAPYLGIDQYLRANTVIVVTPEMFVPRCPHRTWPGGYAADELSWRSRDNSVHRGGGVLHTRSGNRETRPWPQHASTRAKSTTSHRARRTDARSASRPVAAGCTSGSASRADTSAAADQSAVKHATEHFHGTRHPIMRSFEPGEDWGWCYADELFFEPLPDAKA